MGIFLRHGLYCDILVHTIFSVRVREEDSVLEIYRDDTFIPLCAEDFPGTRLDEICASLGKGIVDRR